MAATRGAAWSALSDEGTVPGSADRPRRCIRAMRGQDAVRPLMHFVVPIPD